MGKKQKKREAKAKKKLENIPETYGHSTMFLTGANIKQFKLANIVRENGFVR